VTRSPDDDTSAESRKIEEVHREAELAAERAKRLEDDHERELAEERARALEQARRDADAALARLQPLEDEGRWRWARLERARRARTTAPFLAGTLFSLGLVTLAVLSQVLGADLGLTYRGRLVATICLSAGAFVFLVGALLVPSYLRARKVEHEEEKRAREVAQQAVAELEDAADLAALIKANRKQMEAYDLLARAQAATAFRNSQVAMATGLVVLLVGAVIAIGTPSTTSKITTASLTAIGGMLSGYIARTFLQTYARALRQLNFYFQQPLINSYLLTAQRLIEKMSAGERDPVLSSVVGHVMDALARLPWSGAVLDQDPDGHPSVGAASRSNSKA